MATWMRDERKPNSHFDNEFRAHFNRLTILLR